MTTAMARIDAQIPLELKEKVEHAAHARAQSVTDFLTDALEEATSQVIVGEVTIKLHPEDQIQLAKILIADEPFPPVEKMTRLRQAAKDYAKAVVRK